MAAPDFVRALLGWRNQPSPSGLRNPNTSDSHSAPSIAISSRILRLLDIDPEYSFEGDPGSKLENGLRDFLEARLEVLEPTRDWVLGCQQRVTSFAQYEHLARLERIIREDNTGLLATEIGRDYVIKPDVTVGVRREESVVLHAAVSCKWTIRSDRVQNIRHEAVILTRHRRGRQPHIVAVTAEPLASRIASIARGTGEIDAVYHVAFEELQQAIGEVGTSRERDVLHELVQQGRLLDLQTLPSILSL